ncbi:MAG: SDR family oxidoreductase [Verrucomicrobia bacterium]|nr:SDR family oxidoreductase [Verrucomicrobiota bacterium]MBU4248616.1 SDR family oxidoreductase [Verrucomicrobiota bacterium]MBU4290077.1 SDR family oxidoreductase [Verrucomicrobiota bacterium]MBU4430479.1 SDR family oxidoreductase [Verrucomicrobiota bacterium]MBU4497751.1 SDR family oxidoreductase [Verrucomicrobiota bacterium]
MELFSLEGKIAAITGAGGVLFGAVACGLAELGVKIASLDLRLAEAQKTADAVKAQGGDALGVEIDVLKPDSVAQARDAVLAQYGRVDILINGAGGNHPKATTNKEAGVFFPDLSVDGIRFAFDLNIMGTVIPSMIFGKVMIQQKEGIIINTSSMSAEMPLSRVMAYSAAKAGVSNFTKWLAADMAMNHSPNIRVNEIRPGFFPTLQNAELINKTPGILTATRGSDILGGTPMKRYGKPEELVGAIVYLCSPSASFTTGSSIAIDGGFGSFSGV